VAEMVSRIESRSAALDLFLQSKKDFQRVFCSSGLIAESKTMLEALRRAGQETVCLEGWAWRPGHMIYNLNDPALDYNVSGWLSALGPWDEGKEKEIDAYLRFLDGEKRADNDWLENFYLIQRSNVSGNLAPELRRFVEGDAPLFLLAPNVIGDSSTLRRETIFPSMQTWLRETISFFKTRRELKLVIRAHPAERWIGDKCVVFLAEQSRKLSEGVPNIFVIDSSDKVNTFSLLPFTRAGLVWLSSAGVDFVVRGVPTVCAALPKYHGLEIVREPRTRQEYFDQIDCWAARTERPTAAQIQAGKRYLHLVFKGFSFEATGRNYRATGCRLGEMPNQAEHDRFYRILAGEEKMPDRI